MLSDRGSRVIRAYGIFNVNIPRSLPLYGIPFPGQYLIGAGGVVRDKQFLNDYRERPTASEVLLQDFGAGRGAKVRIRADDVQATLQLSSDRAFAGQELGMAVGFTVKPPWHIYGEPLPSNYTPTALRLDSAAVSRQSLKFPPARLIRIASLGESMPVYSGSFRAAGVMVLAGGLKPGAHQIGGQLQLQECNDELCKLPRTIDFSVPVTIQSPAGK